MLPARAEDLAARVQTARPWMGCYFGSAASSSASNTRAQALSLPAKSRLSTHPNRWALVRPASGGQRNQPLRGATSATGCLLVTVTLATIDPAMISCKFQGP